MQLLTLHAGTQKNASAPPVRADFPAIHGWLPYVFFPDVSSYMVLSYHFRIWVCLKTRYTVPQKVATGFCTFPMLDSSLVLLGLLPCCCLGGVEWLFHLDVSEKNWTWDIPFDIPPTLFFPNDFNDDMMIDLKSWWTIFSDKPILRCGNSLAGWKRVSTC